MIRTILASLFAALAITSAGCALPPGPLTGIIDGWNNNTSNAPGSDGYYSPMTKS